MEGELWLLSEFSAATLSVPQHKGYALFHKGLGVCAIFQVESYFFWESYIKKKANVS